MLFAAPDGLLVAEKERGVLPGPRGRERTPRVSRSWGSGSLPPLGRMRRAEPNSLPRPPRSRSLDFQTQ